MEELLGLYTEIIRGATDEQLPIHLANLVKDAAQVADVVKNIVEQARQRTATPQS